MLNFRRVSVVFALAVGLVSVGSAQAWDWKGALVQKAENVIQSRTGAAPRAPGADGTFGSFSSDGNGTFAQCADQFPQNKPLDPKGVNPDFKARALCFDNFAVLYSGLTKTPMMTIERLNAERIQNAKGLKRTDRFYEEARLPSAMRATLNDYKGSGMDRGHMAPAGDMPNLTAMAQSFSLANMVPQDPENNRGAWSRLESDVRKYAARAPGNTFVFTGPLFSHAGKKTTGPGKVWIPDQLFKLVYNDGNQRAFAYILDNTAEARVQAPMEYTEFVQRTKYDPLKGLPVAAPRAK